MSRTRHHRHQRRRAPQHPSSRHRCVWLKWFPDEPRGYPQHLLDEATRLARRAGAVVYIADEDGFRLYAPPGHRLRALRRTLARILGPGHER